MLWQRQVNPPKQVLMFSTKTIKTSLLMCWKLFLSWVQLKTTESWKTRLLKLQLFLAACLLGYVFAKEKVQSVTPADLEEGQPTNVSPKQFNEGIGIQNGGNRSWTDCHWSLSFRLQGLRSPVRSLLIAKQVNEKGLQRTTVMSHSHLLRSNSLKGSQAFGNSSALNKALGMHGFEHLENHTATSHPYIGLLSKKKT